MQAALCDEAAVTENLDWGDTEAVSFTRECCIYRVSRNRKHAAYILIH